MSSPERNIKLVVEYDGTEWHGWQVQKNAKTVQGALEQALGLITKGAVSITGASRTDAGVHARGQVCNFRTTSRIPEEKWSAAVNSCLPPGIAVVAASEVALDWHARIHARGKLYSYRINTREAPLAMERRFALHYPHALDVTAMQTAALCLVGEHDFAAFQAAGSSVKDTVRTIHELKITADQHDLLLTVSGNGFLYNMVRIIVGTLLLVGNGKLSAGAMQQILAGRDRSHAGPTAPAHGLCLEQVLYD